MPQRNTGGASRRLLPSRQQRRRKLATTARSGDDKAAGGAYRTSHATKDLTAWFGEASAPLLSGEVRKARGPKHHKGVDGASRLTGARTETSGHLSFQAQSMRRTRRFRPSRR